MSTSKVLELAIIFILIVTPESYTFVNKATIVKLNELSLSESPYYWLVVASFNFIEEILRAPTFNTHSHYEAVVVV